MAYARMSLGKVKRGAAVRTESHRGVDQRGVLLRGDFELRQVGGNEDAAVFRREILQHRLCEGRSLRRIGAVADLPTSALIARFGEEGGRLHARAKGLETEPFRARRATKRLALALPIEPPVEELEPLRFVLHRLVAGLTGQLGARGLAADRALLVLELDLAFAPTGTSPRIEVEQRFPEPTADAEAVERLLFARLEREPPPAAVQRLDLELRGTTPAAGQQLPLFVPQAARTARLDWQLARLALTFGEDRVRRVAITDPEAPLPEERWAWQGVGLGEDDRGGAPA